MAVVKSTYAINCEKVRSNYLIFSTIRRLGLSSKGCILNLTFSLEVILTFTSVSVWHLSFFNGYQCQMDTTAFMVVIDTQQTIATWEIAFPAFW